MRIPNTCLLVGAVALAMASQISANLLTNPGFEDPFGTEWAFTRVSGTEAKWGYAQSSTRVHSGSSSLRMHFGTDAGLGTAYVEQVISGLTPGDPFDISAWINLDWRATKATAYIEVLGGGSPVQAPSQGGNTDDAWQEWTLSQTADAGGNLTIRLYLDKYGTTTADKDVIAYYDDVVVIPEPGSILLLLAGFLGLGALRRRR
ncbi:MAG: PEP-CTERM sorting domain-containing protein [Planctomycetes bacterium]|nr:PEP-CTERM sorting domain-containing protein [Planctomycetota bacterium]